MSHLLGSTFARGPDPVNPPGSQAEPCVSSSLNCENFEGVFVTDWLFYHPPQGDHPQRGTHGGDGHTDDAAAARGPVSAGDQSG